MRVSKRRRPPARQAIAVAGQLLWLFRLPPRVALFYVRCLVRAVRTGDQWTIDVVTRPRELSALIRVSRGRKAIVEDGTASGWTAAALAVADRTRTVISFDPEPHAERERYLRLLDETIRSRIRLVNAGTEQGPAALGQGTPVPAVDLMFLDGDHSRTGVLAAFEAWSPALAAGALLAFHDYGDPDYPGVAEAIAELGLTGTVRGTMFVGRV